jgi:hypothetical protein
LLAAGLVARRADRTVCGMLAGAGLGGVWHHSRAHRFFATARWSADAVGLVVLGLVTGWLIPAGAPVVGDARRRAGGNNPLLAHALTAAIRTGHRNPNAAMRTLVRYSRAARAAACSPPRRQKGASVAKLAAISPTTHHLFLSQTSQLPANAAPPFAAEWVHKVEACRQSLTQPRPDVLVIIGWDRFHQLWLYNMPQFLVGKAPLSPIQHQHLTLPGGTP